MSINFSTAIPKWLNENPASEAPGSSPDPEYDAIFRRNQDDTLDCTQYINDVVEMATGYNIADHIGQELFEARHGDHNGYFFPEKSSWNTGGPGYIEGSLLVENWQNFFVRKDIWHELDMPPTVENPPSGMQPGDVILLKHDKGSGNHAVIVKAVDSEGHPTEIAQSSGEDYANSMEAVSFKSWADFSESCSEQGMEMMGYGRIDDLA